MLTIAVSMGAAYAQTPSNQTASAAQVEEVVVSASRVNRSGYTAPTPTTVIGSDTLDNKAAVVISDAVFDIPQVRPAPNAAGTSQASGNFANLRGFGATRTLTLVDGRRFVPTNGAENSGGSSVDLNVVPEALVDRIDVVTGGASAAWGSDAVGGVVNIVLKHSLDGIQGRVQYGVSEYGDNQSVSANLAGGTSFAGDRGQIMVAAEYSHSFDMMTYGDRPWSAAHCGFVPQTVNGIAYTAVKTCGLTLTGYTNGGVIVASNGAPLASNNPLYGKQFLNSTSSSPFNYGVLKGSSVAVGGDGGWKSDFSHPFAPLLRKTLYSHASYEITDNITAFAEASYSEAGTKVDLFVNSITSGTDTSLPIQIFAGNPYIPADIQAIMTANKISSFYMTRIAPDLGFARTESGTSTVRYAGGFDGKFGDGWTWHTYLAYGNNRYDTLYKNNLIESNLRAALDVVTNPATGKPDCRVNVFGPAAAGAPEYGAMPFCVPANPFGPGSLASAKGYITQVPLDQFSKYEQTAAGGTIQGTPFSTWAGPISVVGGAEYRHDDVHQWVSPYSDFLNPPSFSAGNYQQSDPKSFAGGTWVAEGFGETVVPLLADHYLAKSLDFDGAVRYTHYSRSGGVVTWKTGLTYKPIEGVLIRAAQSDDIRAPSLFELFGSNTTYGQVTMRGPGGVALGLVNITSPGANNLNLKPEEALTTTAGISFTNFLIDGFSMSVDGYRIFLKDEIGKLGAQGIVDTCYGGGTAAGTTPNPASCALITAGGTVITNPFLNVGTIYTTGFDIEASYRMQLSDLFSGLGGSLNLRFLANNVQTLKNNSTGLSVTQAAGDSGTPHWRWTASATYASAQWIVNFTGRYLGDQTRYNLAPANTFLEPIIPAYFYLDGSVSYNLIDEGSAHVQLFASVKNMLDTAPPFVTGGGTGASRTPSGTGITGYTSGAFYDQVGRAYSVGVRFGF